MVKQKNKIKIAIIIPQRNKKTNVRELQYFLQKSRSDVFILPERYLNSTFLSEVCKIAKENKKWIIGGMDDFREPDKKYETGVVIDPTGNIIGEHKLTSLAPYKINEGYSQGNSIEVIDTNFGKIGIVICYEFHHLPEVSIVYKLKGARIIFVLMNFGAHDEKQYKKMNNIACARASENRVFILGCSHFDNTMPFVLAYAPNGECLLQSEKIEQMVEVEVDFDKYNMTKELKERSPELYEVLVK